MSLSSVEFVSKTKKLEYYFIEDLSIPKIMIRREAFYYLFASIITAFLALVILVCNITNANWVPLLYVILLSVLCITLSFISVRISNLFAMKKYPRFKSIFTNKKITYTYDVNFLFAFRCDKIKRKVRNLGLIDNLDNLIEFYLNKSTEIRTKRWWPISLIGLVLFPLWSEYVGNQIEESLKNIPILLLFAGTLIYLTYNIKSIIETLWLSKANKYGELVEILKTLKML